MMNFSALQQQSIKMIIEINVQVMQELLMLTKKLPINLLQTIRFSELAALLY